MWCGHLLAREVRNGWYSRGSRYESIHQVCWIHFLFSRSKLWEQSVQMLQTMLWIMYSGVFLMRDCRSRSGTVYVLTGDRKRTLQYRIWLAVHCHQSSYNMDHAIQKHHVNRTKRISDREVLDTDAVMYSTLIWIHRRGWNGSVALHHYLNRAHEDCNIDIETTSTTRARNLFGPHCQQRQSKMRQFSALVWRATNQPHKVQPSHLNFTRHLSIRTNPTFLVFRDVFDGTPLVLTAEDLPRHRAQHWRQNVLWTPQMCTTGLNHEIPRWAGIQLKRRGHPWLPKSRCKWKEYADLCSIW